MEIRTATLSDLSAVAAVEAACFPLAEAATEKQFAARLRAFPSHFWLLEDEGKLIAFADGMVTNEPAIRDEMYADALLHRENGAWQTVFGLNTLPEYRRRGCAALLINRITADAKAQGRKGCILTCKEELIAYYQRFGYRTLGISQSVHGGVIWHDMCLEF